MNHEDKRKIVEKAVEDFGSVVHNFRVENGLTLQDMADIVSCSPAYVWRIEQHRRFPSLDVRIRFLEQGMGFSAEDIYLYLEEYMKKEKNN